MAFASQTMFFKKYFFSILCIIIPLSSQQYKTYNDVVKYLKELKQNHSSLMQLINIGHSVDKRDILLVRISTGIVLQKTNVSEKYSNHIRSRQLLRPTVKLIGTIHGDEPLGAYLLLQLIGHLLTTYHTDNRTKQLVQNANIEILPLMNPDGFSVAKEGDCNGVRIKNYWNGRENKNNVDLESNFTPDLENDYVSIEPETLSVMTWSVSNPSIILSASIHTGLKAIIYPFYSNNITALDQSLFKQLGTNYIENHTNSTDFLSGCPPGYVFKNGLVSGYDLSPTKSKFASNEICFVIKIN